MSEQKSYKNLLESTKGKTRGGDPTRQQKSVSKQLFG